MSVKIILINLHLTTCESLKNQVFIRQSTASKSSAALIIAPAQYFYSSSSSTRLWCLLILSDSAARKLLPESRAMKVAFRPRKARIFVTHLRKIILSTQGCKERTGCRWKKGSKGASKLTILGLHGRNVSLCTEGDTLFSIFFPSCPGFSFHQSSLIENISIHYSLSWKWIGNKNLAGFISVSGISEKPQASYLSPCNEALPEMLREKQCISSASRGF